MPYLRSKCFKFRLIRRISSRMEGTLCRFVLLWVVVFVKHSSWRKSKDPSTLASDNSMSAMRSLACWNPRKILSTSTERCLFTRIWTWHTAYSTNRTSINSFVELQLLHAGFSGTSLMLGDPAVIPDFPSIVKIAFPPWCCWCFKPPKQSPHRFQNVNPGSCISLNWTHHSSRLPAHVQAGDAMNWRWVVVDAKFTHGSCSTIQMFSLLSTTFVNSQKFNTRQRWCVILQRSVTWTGFQSIHIWYVERQLVIARLSPLAVLGNASFVSSRFGVLVSACIFWLYQ